MMGHREWAAGAWDQPGHKVRSRKTDPDYNMTGMRARIAAHPSLDEQAQEEDEMRYTEWPMADKVALCNDVWRMLSTGRKPDGTTAQHLVDGSIGRAVALVDLVRVGDNPDPAGGETHPENLRTILAKIETGLDGIRELLDRTAPPVPTTGAGPTTPGR